MASVETLYECAEKISAASGNKDCANLVSASQMTNAQEVGGGCSSDIPEDDSRFSSPPSTAPSSWG